MIFKKGMIVGFKIDDDDDGRYVDWFKYAIKSGARAKVTGISFSSIQCELVDYDEELYNMKEGFLTITTAKRTVCPISSYQEV